MANKDDTCFKVFTTMFKVKIYNENIRSKKQSRNFYSPRGVTKKRQVNISNARQKENKARFDNKRFEVFIENRM